MMRKKVFFSVLLVFAVFLSTVLSGCSAVKRAERALYRELLLSDLVTGRTEIGRLPGMADGLAVLTGEEDFDRNLVNAPFCGLFDGAGENVYYEKDALEKIFPASLTKMMTALLTVENCPDLSEEVKVSGEAFTGIDASASQADLTAGASYTVEELLFALLVPSGNDAANALAIHVAGSTEAFVEKMNARAKELGMLNTHFVNPHGLHDKKHYTTVYDLYLLVHECLKYPVLQSIAGTAEISITGTCEDGTVVSSSYVSANSYLRNFTVPPEGLKVDFSKTGYTKQAGRCLILVTEDEAGKKYIAVMAGVETYDELYAEMNRMLEIVR